MTQKTFLHIGCGPKRKDRTTRGFNSNAWIELRLDIDPDVNPDITGTMLDMSEVETASVDAVFSSHNTGILNQSGFAWVAINRREQSFYDLCLTVEVSPMDDLDNLVFTGAIFSGRLP